jgi:uncharacterized iron-regulated membrane protein
MAFNFASAKNAARQAVHTTLGVTALYEDDATNAPVEIKARWHNKIELSGDLDSQSYAEVIQGVDRVIFAAADARAIPVKRGGTITIPDYENIVFTLALMEPSNGPYTEVWQVARSEAA